MFSLVFLHSVVSVELVNGASYGGLHIRAHGRPCVIGATRAASEMYNVV